MSKMCFSLVFALLVGLYMGPSSVAALPSAEYEEVLFNSSNLVENLEMPASCSGQTYCFDKGTNYPEEKIADLLSDMRELRVENPEEREDIDIGSRNGDSYDEPDCPSNSTENPIYYITDVNDKVRVVVQSPTKFQQIYSVKWCLNEGLITRDTLHFLKSTTLKKFNIECVSTKMNFEFFVLRDEVDPVTRKPKMEIATAKGGIPVCCRCRYDVDD